jgi:hypothetical protein
VITPDEARALALALPGAEERSHFDVADFRVRGKIFATLPPGDDRMVVRVDPAEQAVLLAAEPATFSPASGVWGLRGWTVVQLGSVEVDVLRDLLVDSWRRLASKKVAAAYELVLDGEDSPAPP